MPDVLAAPLRYLDRGWSVFPCRPADKRPFGEVLPRVVGADGEEHATWTPFQHERPTEARVRAWWTDHPAANIAVVTGAVSGIVVLDLDDKPGGANGMETLRRAGEELPETRCVRTPSGGLHCYYRHPGGDLRNWQKRADMPGVDARGDGGYVVAPPSRTAAGVYRAVPKTRDLPFANPPDWLVDGMSGRAARASGTPGAADEWADLWSTFAGEGDRHPTLIRLIGHLIEHGIRDAEAAALAVLWDEARCAPPKGEAEVRATVADLFQRYGAAGIAPADDTEALTAFKALPSDVRTALLDREDRNRRLAGAVEAIEAGCPPEALARLLLARGEADPAGVVRWAQRRAKSGGARAS